MFWSRLQIVWIKLSSVPHLLNQLLTNKSPKHRIQNILASHNQKQNATNKSLKKLMQIYPHWKEVDLEVLDKIITDRELEELIEAHGIEPK